MFKSAFAAASVASAAKAAEFGYGFGGDAAIAHGMSAIYGQAQSYGGFGGFGGGHSHGGFGGHSHSHGGHSHGGHSHGSGSHSHVRTKAKRSRAPTPSVFGGDGHGFVDQTSGYGEGSGSVWAKGESRTYGGARAPSKHRSVKSKSKIAKVSVPKVVVHKVDVHNTGVADIFDKLGLEDDYSK